MIVAAVDSVHLLRDLYLEIIVPPAVHRELSNNGIELDLTWARIVGANNQSDVTALREQLDPGEAEAIATELRAGLLLIDEKLGRRIAALKSPDFSEFSPRQRYAV